MKDPPASLEQALTLAPRTAQCEPFGAYLGPITTSAFAEDGERRHRERSRRRTYRLPDTAFEQASTLRMGAWTGPTLRRADSLVRRAQAPPATQRPTDRWWAPSLLGSSLPPPERRHYRRYP